MVPVVYLSPYYYSTLQVTQPVGYVGTLPSVQFEYTGGHGRVDRKGRLYV
jgi:hypothetical protein